MKFERLIVKFFLLFMSLMQQVKTEASPEWCWTVPDMKIKVQPNKFGYNYGLCQASKGAATPDTKIKITVKMPNMKGFGGNSGPFKMRMASKEIQGDEFVLKEGIFKEDENYSQQFDTASVGEVQTIEIMMDDKETGFFTCDTITIEDGPKNFEFKCAGVLDKKSRVMSLTKQETVEYDVTMVAGKEDADQTKDPIFIAIKGDKGVTEFQIFSDEGVQIEPVNNKVELPNMGKFQCVYVRTYGAEALLLTNLKLQAPGGEPIEFKNEDAQKVECPENCEVAFCKGGPPSKPNPPPPGNDDPDAGVDDDDDAPQPEPASPYPDTGKFNCATLTVAEKDNLKSLTCKTTAIQIFDDEQYLNKNINYEMRFGICPPNCLKDAICQGRGIHNPASTICGAAMADGSIPKSGGCVAIIKTKGVGSYGKAKVSNGIKIEMGSGSEWGFFTHKADSPDFSKSDIRILNHKGEPEFTGRVEFRIAGRWGSVNMKGTEQSSARYICKTLNYIDGEWMNDPEVKDFCETYLEKDHCGFKGQAVHYQSYKCDNTAESLTDCYREIASEHDHKDDAIIKCSMTDTKQSDSVSPKQGQVRAVGTDGSPSQSSTGRVEMWVDGKWGTVCNKGFNDASGEIACKQLGFTGGKAIGQPGAHKACIVGKEDYCVKEGTKLVAEGFKCTGKEKQLTDCGGNFKSKCSAFQSAMIKCDGSDGDTSGNTPAKDGPPPPKVPRPQLGNLPLSNPYRLKCDTTLNHLDFPGDPGSIYLGFCPSGCHNSDAILRGTSIYTHDSSICKAAIHSGVNQHKGGGISIIITYGQAQYEGSLNRKVESVGFKYSKKSFMIAQITSIHKAWSISTYFAPFVGLLSQNTKHLVQGAIKHNPTSFVQLKSKVLNTQISSVAQTFKNYLQAQALLQLHTKQNSNRIFEYYSPKNYAFSPNESADCSELEKNDELQKLKQFTIMMEFVIDKDNGQIELFGHSECQCWGLLYDSDGLHFGEKCSENMINLGMQIAGGKKYHIAITYDPQSQSLILVSNGKTIYNDKHSFKFQCTQKVNIGYNSFSKSKYLIGKISYINVFNKVISPPELEEKTIQAPPTPTKTPQQGGDTPDGQKAFKNTQDSRKCVSPCITDPFPEQPNAPEAPSAAVLGGSSGGPGSEGPSSPDDSSSDEGSTDQSSPDEAPEKEEPIVNAGCLDLHCDDTLEKSVFQGEVGKQTCIYCPKGCWKTPFMVIGSQIFYKTSSICKAAIHDGKISDKEGGELIVVLNNPIKLYQGTSANSVNSKELQTSEPSISFVLKKSEKIFDLKCETLGTDPLFEKVSGTIKVKCPVKCSFVPNIVFGFGKYTDTSSVCQAAIHAGASSDNGGHFQLQFLKAGMTFDAKKKNEIKSAQFDNTKESVKKAMIFLANRADAAGFFTEKYERDITDGWYFVDDGGAIQGPSEWKFGNHPVHQEKTALSQYSPMVMKKAGKYATKLFHKEFDSDDALFKINIWQEKKSVFGIFIRYYDDNNYYCFKFNTAEESQILLVKRVAGVDKIIGQYSQDIPLKQWNRFFIVFDEQVIEMYMQSGEFRNTPKIIGVVDPDVQRGKVGLATNGNANVFFDGIVLKQYDPNVGIMDSKSQNIRTWDECLKPVNQSHRDKYCQKVNGNAKWAIPACKKLLNFCEYCCTDIIPRWERIILYNCVSTCVRSTRRHEAQLRNKQSDNDEKPYIPKKGDKIDYMHPKIGKFIPALVKDVKKGEEEGSLIVDVSYYITDGEFAKDTIDFPDRKNRIQKCKKILTGRNDCGDQ